MIAKKITDYIENWAPVGAAWEKDNVGLQVGSLQREITNVFLCLELTEKVLDEAIKKNSNFIFTHHPFIFTPLKNINTANDLKAKIIEKLIKNNITLYSAHTNLDFTKEGVSFELAKILNLNETKFLVNQKRNQYKVAVFVPEEYLEGLAEALHAVGAGIIGEYEKCSFRTIGEGTFQGSENSTPTYGLKEKLENVNEIKLEVLVDKWKLNKVINVIRKKHPYEEPAFDIIPVENENVNYGYGVIGSLSKSMTQNEFLTHICKSLNTNNIRYTKGKRGKIKSVAVCGGSGSDLLESAISKKADAFVTADLKYHTFQDGEDRVLFVDAGHYETEIIVLDAIKKKLEKLIKINGETLRVFKFSGSTNPVKFFNNKGVK